jgi:hypothetical protein
VKLPDQLTTAAAATHQVTARHFVAGMVVREGRIAEAPPILQWTTNWRWDQFLIHAGRKGWRVEEVS